MAVELGCDWHTVNDTIIAYGTSLVDDDPDRFGVVEALGLDEVLIGPARSFSPPGVLHPDRRRRSWPTVSMWSRARTVLGPSAWLAEQGKPWCDRVRFATLDLSGPYRRVFTPSCSPTPSRWRTPFHLRSARPTPSSTSAGAGCRTRPSVIAVGSPILSIAVGGS